MRSLGNGVYRAESRELIRSDRCFSSAARGDDVALLEGPLPDHLMDLVESAILALGSGALGYVLAAPVRGVVRYVDEGFAELTLRLVGVM